MMFENNVIIEKSNSQRNSIFENYACSEFKTSLKIYTTINRIVGSPLKISLPATEFDNLWINIELHSKTIKSVHNVLMKLS